MRYLILLVLLSACASCIDHRPVVVDRDAAVMADSPPAPTDAPPSTLIASGTSQDVTWSCIGDPCPWGASLHNQALSWPAGMTPSAARLGYQASAGVYLPSSVVDGLTIVLTSGRALLYEGIPGQLERFAAVAALEVGQPWTIRPHDGRVVSVEGSGDAFGWELRR